MSSPYRPDSLDSLVSTNDLDQASSLIRFRSFLFFAVFTLLISIGVLCCIFIEIPIKVSGPSVVWSDEGVLQVAAKFPGSVKKFNIRVGDRVEKGQKIAELDQSRIRENLRATIKKRDFLQKFIKDISEVRFNDRKKSAELDQENLRLTDGAIKDYESRISESKNREKILLNLIQSRQIQYEQYRSEIDRIEQARDKIYADEKMKISDLKDQLDKKSTEDRERLQKQLELNQLQSEVYLLQNQLQNEGNLTSPVGGRVLEIKASVGDYLSPGSPLILVEPDASESQLTVVVFISSEQVKPVKLGDRTELELSAFPPTKFGRLEAKVKSISPMPMSSSGLMKELRNDHLVSRITEGGSPFMVKAEISKDLNTGRFKWSSSSKTNRKIQQGMVGQGSIITRKEKLIWLLLPKAE